MSRILLVIIMCSGCATKPCERAPMPGHGPCPFDCGANEGTTWFIWDEFLK